MNYLFTFLLGIYLGIGIGWVWYGWDITWDKKQKVKMCFLVPTAWGISLIIILIQDLFYKEENDNGEEN